MLALLAALLMFMNPVTYMLAQGNESLAKLAKEYLTPLIFVGPLMMLIMGMAQFVRTDGRPRLAAQIALTANVVSVISCYVFIRFLDTGIAGASLSTLLGYIVGIFVMLPYLFSKERSFRFVKLVKGDLPKLFQIVSIGMPDALSQGLSFMRVIVLNMLIVRALGEHGMAAMTVCLNMLMISFIFISGTTDTLLPIVSTLYGEKDYKGIRFTMRTGVNFTLVTCIAMIAALLAFPAKVGQLFGISSQEGLAVVVPALRMYAASLLLYSVNTLLQSFFQTTGREKLALLLVILNGFVFVVFFALLFAKFNAHLIWLSFALAELAAFLVLYCVILRIRKKENVSGILLLRKEDEAGVSLDLSIRAAVEAAVGISEQVIRFCRENGVDESSAMRMGIALEEMSVNTARYGHKNNKGVIDVLVRIADNELILRLRDNGAPFNPAEYHPEEKETFAVGGIEVVRRLAKNISYVRQLGFNVTVITISALPESA
jgi:Na+-driven multidrug efflux pump/anti-sigma regulatory factor (Ser/Thr protein kinase)